jgi:hypothetical protein
MFYMNQPLAMSFDGGYDHVHVLYESTSRHEFWQRLRPHPCFIRIDFSPRALMLVCDDDRVFPNKLDPFDRIISNLLDGLTWGAISTTPRVVALRVVSTSCHKHGSHATMLAFFPNWLDQLDWVISNLLDGLTWGAISTMPKVVALGVVLTSCHKHGSHATMLAFFPNWLDCSIGLYITRWTGSYSELLRLLPGSLHPG